MKKLVIVFLLVSSMVYAEDGIIDKILIHAGMDLPEFSCKISDDKYITKIGEDLVIYQPSRIKKLSDEKINFYKEHNTGITELKNLINELK